MVEASGDERTSDEDLLARIADEDRGAFTSLMRRHGKTVRGLAFAFSGRAADARCWGLAKGLRNNFWCGRGGRSAP